MPHIDLQLLANTVKLKPDLQDLNNMGPLLKELQYTSK